MRRNFKIVFYMRGNYVNKEGKSAIMLRLSLDGKRITIGATGIAVTPSLWEMQQQRLRGRSTEAMQVNHQLDVIRAELLDISNRLEVEGRLSLGAVRSAYLREDAQELTIGWLFDKHIETIKEQVGVNLSATSYHKYDLCKSRFMAMLEARYKCQDIRLDELTPVMIENYHIYLTTVVGHCHNTATKTLKTLKTVMYYGKKLGVIQHDPFLGVKFHLDPVDRGFLTEEELERIMKKNFSVRRLELVRDIFVFACFTGLSYIDVSGLTYQNLVTLNGTEWIIAKRQKTNTPINVVLLKVAKQLIKKYENDKQRKNRVFPMISNQKMNSYLKEIGDLCGINKNMSFHLARHTFATMTLSMGVPIESVSKMLGHTNIKTTQIYARITNKKIEQDMKDFAQKVSNFNGLPESML